MQKLEPESNVSLFNRSKNSIAFNRGQKNSSRRIRGNFVSI